MKNLIIASTSTIYGSGFLEYLLPELREHFKSIKSLLFIPYARPGGISHEAYTEAVAKSMQSLSIAVHGIHEFDDPEKAIEKAEAIFVGGGNTFVLLKALQQKKLIDPLRIVLDKGTPYLGTSAGSNIVAPNVKTTNDMPIVHPTSLDALNLIPFNINAHYLDPIKNSTHKGETRPTRIKEFHVYNSETVLGLREGSWISVKGEKMLLKGPFSAVVFRRNMNPFEIETDSDLGILLT
ncbi:dipeptidase PepE [Lutimonas vermicola]|uniref:Dipeptidase PepE n=1 Tax=Lutimonas vermicola TaxID=414288 RepID=A0ABU9KZ22_9FLAO